MRAPLVIVSIITLAAGVLFLRHTTDECSPSSVRPSLDTVGATRLLHRQPGFFVPNLGQWQHPARFVHRSGPMTLFLEDRGWVLDLVERPVHPETRPNAVHQAVPGDRNVDQEIHAVALRMTFEGAGHGSEIMGEKKLAGHHNYFLGNDESRWRTGVPLYDSVRYENLYPGIDLRLREANGVPEYDLLLQPGADLALVTVHVEGGQGMSIARDGSLVIETALGSLTQSVPKTWDVGADGSRREVACNFTLLGADRFGFLATGWNGDTSLTIDPGLIWSTYLGDGPGFERVAALALDATGVVTVAGSTSATGFPTTTGAYDRTHNGGTLGYDIYVSRLDPTKIGAAQLLYSTFLGGTGYHDYAESLAVDARGVVTVAGYTQSTDFPMSSGAYDTVFNGGTADVFVSRLDPRKTGTAQLTYSTYVGGSRGEIPNALSVAASGVITMAGWTKSANFPTTSGAWNQRHNGPANGGDIFVSRLDPRKTGGAQLVYSTYLGGKSEDYGYAIAVDAGGVITVAGTSSSLDFPTIFGAYDRINNSFSQDVVICRLDPSKPAIGQLVYSTYFGSKGNDYATDIVVDSSGVMTFTGYVTTTNFPTTNGAFDRTPNGRRDAYVSRLDPRKTGTAQLVYSTLLGGSAYDDGRKLSVDANGVVTVAGTTNSTSFPTTSDAYNTTYNGGYGIYYGDSFVSRLDPSKTGNAQLVYSTFFGGSRVDAINGLAVDASGAVTIAGVTDSRNFPTTTGAYDRSFFSLTDAFVSRLDMGVAMYGDVHAMPITTGGTQKLTVNAGKAHANRLYWVFGSVTGTSPGVNLLGVHIPLNPDPYTDIAIVIVNTPLFTRFKGRLDANGLATAAFNVPANLPFPPGFTFYHGYVVYDASGKFYMASNAVPLRLK